MLTNCVNSTEIEHDILWIQLSNIAESYHSFTQGEGVDTLHNVIDFLKKKNTIWSLIPVMSLVKIVLFMPATNASSECTFSALRRGELFISKS